MISQTHRTAVRRSLLSLAIFGAVLTGRAQAFVPDGCEVHSETGSAWGYENGGDWHQENGMWFDWPAAVCPVDDPDLDFEVELTQPALSAQVMYGYELQDAGHNPVLTRSDIDLVRFHIHMQREAAGVPAQMNISLLALTFEGSGDYLQTLAAPVSSLFTLHHIEPSSLPGVNAAVYRGGYDLAWSVRDSFVSPNSFLMTTMMPQSFEFVFLTTVPEPASAALLAVASLFAARRRTIR